VGVYSYSRSSHGRLRLSKCWMHSDLPNAAASDMEILARKTHLNGTDFRNASAETSDRTEQIVTRMVMVQTSTSCFDICLPCYIYIKLSCITLREFLCLLYILQLSYIRIYIDKIKIKTYKLL
jgi:hypothetical protein